VGTLKAATKQKFDHAAHYQAQAVTELNGSLLVWSLNASQQPSVCASLTAFDKPRPK